MGKAERGLGDSYPTNTVEVTGKQDGKGARRQLPNEYSRGELVSRIERELGDSYPTNTVEVNW